MSDTNNPFYTNEEWVQYYQETPANPSAPVMVSGSVDYGTTMMTGFASNNVSSSSIISSSGGGGGGIINSSSSIISSSGGGGGGIINSSSNSPLKPVRRRSRASKRTPVTLLNASATNFRALVQQFTGCPQATGGALLGRQKGPVNLSFERNEYALTESNKSTNTSYDQQGLTQTLPQQLQGNIFGETATQENGFIDESSINGRSSNGGYFF